MKRCQNIWAGPPPLIWTKSKRRAVFPQEKVPQLKGNLDINHVEKLSKNILVDQKYQLFQMTLFDNRNLGRHQQKKNIFFRALPESPKPPP